MIFSTIKNIFSLLSHVTQQGAVEKDRKRRKPRLWDMLEARMLSEEARKRNVELSALLKKSRADWGEEKMRRNVRKKVDSFIAPYYKQPDIIEEVTEKLVDVAANDPVYKRWFS